MIIGVGNRQLAWVYVELNRSYPGLGRIQLYSDGAPSLNAGQSVPSHPPPCSHAEHYQESSSTRLLTSSATPIGTVITTNVPTTVSTRARRFMHVP